MNAPLIWIITPSLVAAGLFILRRWYRLIVWVGTLVSLLFAGLAWLVPIGETIILGPWSFRISDTLSLLGRRLVITSADQPLLVLVYLLAAFWFAASYVARAGRHFVPLGLGMVTALIAALAVEPFLYAALLIELAALLAIPILSAPGLPIQRGVQRFLTFQTLGMPLFLFTGWMLEGAETSPGSLDLVLRAGQMLLLGFLLLLAVFPFHTWVPVLAGQSRPYPVVFILVIIPLMVILFGLGLLDQYPWLRANPDLPLLLQRLGVVFCMTAGIWMAFERDLGRILGYAVLTETGFSILALGLPDGASLLAGMILPRTLALGVWGLALTLLKDRYGDLRYVALYGAAREMPIVSTALLAAQFSIAGFPLLGGFPVRLALWDSVAAQSGWIAFGIFLATIGVFISGLRTLAVVVTGEDETPWKISEPWTVNLFLGIGLVSLVLVGLFPEVFLPVLINILRSFPQLLP